MNWSYRELKRWEAARELLEDILANHQGLVEGVDLDPDLKDSEADSLQAAVRTLKDIEVRQLRERADHFESDDETED